MFDVVYWGNGSQTLGEYTAPKDVSAAAIVQNFNKLIVNGQIQVFDNPVASWQNIPQSQNILRYQKHDGTWVDLPYLSYSIVNRTGYSEFIADLSVGYADPVGRSILSRAGMPYTIFAFGDGRFSGEAVCDAVYASIDNWASRYIEPVIGLAINGQIRFFLGHEIGTRVYGRANIFSSSGISARYVDSFHGDNSGTCNVHVYIEGSHTRLRVQRLDGSFTEFADFISYQEIAQSSCILRVTLSGNTTQDLSYPICPTVERASGCAIAVTYADTTTQQLDIGICPEWARVRGDQECPEGTCSVECEDHICCYGCSGQVVKIIPK